MRLLSCRIQTRCRLSVRDKRNHFASLTLSRTFLESFSLAKYSCNSFLLLSIAFLLGRVLGLERQGPALTAKCLDEKTPNQLPAGQVEPGKAWRPPRAPFPVKRWRNLLYGIARFVTVWASWAHIVSVSRGRAEL